METYGEDFPVMMTEVLRLPSLLIPDPDKGRSGISMSIPMPAKHLLSPTAIPFTSSIPSHTVFSIAPSILFPDAAYMQTSVSSVRSTSKERRGRRKKSALSIIQGREKNEQSKVVEDYLIKGEQRSNITGSEFHTRSEEGNNEDDDSEEWGDTSSAEDYDEEDV